jgi:hypothetical protein
VADPRDLPQTWVPKNADPRARQAWEEHPLARARKLLRPNPKILDEYLPILLGSFSYQDFASAIDRNYDLLPMIRTKGALDHPILGPLGRAVIRIQWAYIFDGLMKPAVIRDKLRTLDPAKASLFDTPKGGIYLNWLCYHLLWMLYERGKIRGGMRVPPPKSVCPLHNGMCTPTSSPPSTQP